MSPKLPALTARKILSTLQKLGFVEARQHGSHKILQHPDGRIVVVPVHSGDVKLPLVLGILRTAGVPREDFLATMKR